MFNSEVQPYATLTGPYAYVAKGAAFRDQGYGLINLTWSTSQAPSTLVAAYLIWSIINNTVPPTNGTVNGIPINGTWVAYAMPSPCWGPTYIYTFVADVTNEVVNGVNNLTRFPSGITNGLDPWSQSQVTLLDDSAALVAIYEPNSTIPIHQVTVYTGALPVSSAGPITQLNYSTANSTSATTTYMVSDGQLYGNSATWDSTVVDANAFPGSDPKESTTPWSYGNLSDTKTYAVNITLGSNNSTAQVSTLGSDCVTWIGQVLSVGVPASRGPYNVTFQEQGLPTGTHWNVTTNGATHSTTVGTNASSVRFKVANGTHPFSIGSIPGFVAQPGANYTVNGGPLFIRLIFHALLYPITFAELGLPPSVAWWVLFTNASQGLSDNVSALSTFSIGFIASNGTYNYTAGELGLYSAAPSQGTVNVTGSPVSVNVTFVPPPLYNVTFRAVGIPLGTQWGGYVTSNWGYFSNYTTTGTYSLRLPNSTAYSDLIDPYAVTGYSAAGYLRFVVSGANETVDVNYSTLYTVELAETGLPANTYWYSYLTNATTGSQYAYSLGSYANFSVVNGSYKFIVEPIYGYVATPSNGTVTVAGGLQVVNIVFTPAPRYVITFTAVGLAPGSLWSVELVLPNSTSVLRNSTSSSLTFNEPNGSYDYFPAATGYSTYPTESTLTLTGANVFLDVNFTKVFSVTFNESGLPSGTYWYVYFNNAYGESYSPSVSFLAGNGSYSFTVYSQGSFIPTPASGTLNVTGADARVSVVYASATSPTYPVEFTETGLASLTNWSVDLAGYLESTTGTSLNFTETNGSYYFEVEGATGYTASPATGTFAVGGAPAIVPIDFSTGSSPTYAVVFLESGLIAGTTWTVTLNEVELTSATDSITFEEPNGSYSYSVATVAGYDAPNPSSGSVGVSGAPPATTDVLFTPSTAATFAVTFTESGLTSGTSWSVTLNGDTSVSTGTTVTFAEANGTYGFTIGAVPGYGVNLTEGSVHVVGSDVGVSIGFTVGSTAMYSVTFQESGLPAGTPWSVTFNGVRSSSATSTIVLQEPNGTYVFTTGVVAGFTANVTHGPLQVQGSSVHVDIGFTAVAPATYSVTFTETGLPAGTSWSVTLNGVTTPSTTTTVVFSGLANGQYSFTVGSVANYTASPSSSSVTVSGGPGNVQVTFSSNAPLTTSGTSGFPTTWLAVGVILAALTVLIFLLASRRRKKEAPPPPPSPPTGPDSTKGPGPGE